jgi:transcriptional regulator with XRE-family HTH domain
MFSDVIHAMRTRRGQMVKDFAQVIGVDPTYITRLEHGSRDPSLAILLRLIAIGNEGERRDLLREIGLEDIDPIAAEVHNVMRSDEWSQSRKNAFRQTVKTLIQTAS